MTDFGLILENNAEFEIDKPLIRGFEKDVLKTYPISCLGHGSGAYIQLTTSFKDIVSYVSLHISQHTRYLYG